MKKTVTGVCLFAITMSTQASCLIRGCKWAAPEANWLDYIRAWFS